MGMLMMTEKNFVPTTYGNWTTTGPAFSKRCATQMRTYVLCRCVCGKKKEIRLYQLKLGLSQSCIVCARVTTGWKLGFNDPDPMIRLMAKRRCRMIARCYDKKNNRYHRYGGRKKPIKVCDRWLDPVYGLRNFIEDMGFPPSPEFEVDRINNDGDYEPGNCRWATAEQQANNRCSNRKITWNGVTKNLGQWAKIQGIPKDTLWRRLNKLEWSVEKALTTPVRKQKTQSVEATLVKE
jgi:hypothetical protein